LESVRRSKGVLVGGHIELRSSQLVHGRFRYHADFVVRVVLDEEAVVIDAPHKPRRLVAPALTNYVQFLFVSWLADGWRVVEVAGE
jgi:hypothetical protein